MHGGTAGLGGAAQNADRTFRPGIKQPLLLSRKWKNDLVDFSLEARTKEERTKTACDPRLGTGSSADHKQDEKRS